MEESQASEGEWCGVFTVVRAHTHTHKGLFGVGKMYHLTHISFKRLKRMQFLLVFFKTRRQHAAVLGALRRSVDAL